MGHSHRNFTMAQRRSVLAHEDDEWPVNLVQPREGDGDFRVADEEDEGDTEDDDDEDESEDRDEDEDDDADDEEDEEVAGERGKLPSSQTDQISGNSNQEDSTNQQKQHTVVEQQRQKKGAPDASSDSEEEYRVFAEPLTKDQVDKRHLFHFEKTEQHIPYHLQGTYDGASLLR